MSVEIRPGRVDDIAGAHACLDAVARERRYLALFEAPPLGRSRSWWEGLIEKGQPFLVAVDGERVIGWCDISPAQWPALRHGGTLGMGLLPEHRGRGIGRRLLVAALEAARRCGLERVGLDVFAGNTRARRLYENCGFLVEGVHQRYAKLDEGYEDSVIMALMLDSGSITEA
jgi:RimJ/RimL family protein N-acetyltransferase